MSIPDEGLPRTAAVSPRVQVIAHTGSTNADLVRRVAEEPDGWPHLSLLLTDDQRAGRGRLDRTWEAPAGTALAISIVLRVADLPLGARGWIPLIAGAAMTEAVDEQLSGSGRHARLKWPNDVLVDPALRGGGAKIAGILAEVVPSDPDTVIVGCGVNTEMTTAQLPVETAASFRAVGLSVEVDQLVARYVTVLDARLRALRAADGDAEASGVGGHVAGMCTTLGREVSVSLPGGASISGTARRLDADGRLVVEVAGGGETTIGAGDVTHVR